MGTHSQGHGSGSHLLNGVLLWSQLNCKSRLKTFLHGFLRVLFVFKHCSFTAQSYFLVLLSLVANPFQFSENHFSVFFYLHGFHSGAGMWLTHPVRPPPPPTLCPKETNVEMNRKHTMSAPEGFLGFI